jgi:hypothetical protein
MTNEQERERVAEILAKQERGENLTDKEWTILAYSPFGTGGGCASRPKCRAPEAGEGGVARHVRLWEGP